MTMIESLHGNVLDILKSDNPADKCSAIETLMNESLGSDTLEYICSLVEDKDKGVRNSVDIMLSINPSEQIPRLLIKYISSQSISTRNLAGEILLKIGDKAIDAMLSYLDTGNDDDKKFIIDILGLIGNQASAAPILKVMKENDNDNVILACIEALGYLKYEDALETMFQFYERNEFYKPTIIESLGKIGSKKSLDFITLKYNDEDDLIRFSIIESLGLIGDEESFFFLLSELSRTSGPIIWPIINSIYELKEKFNFDVPYDEGTKAALLQTIYQAEPKYRKAAVYLITAFDDEEIYSTCLKVYGEDSDLDEIIKNKIFEKPLVLLSIIPVLINKNSGNIRNLLELTKETIEIYPSIIKDVLPNLSQRDLADSISKCLDDPDEEVRKYATELLFSIDENIAVLFLDKMLEDDNIWNKLKLLEILSNVRLAHIEPALTKMANDPEEMISERAKNILSQKQDFQFETKHENNL